MCNLLKGHKKVCVIYKTKLDRQTKKLQKIQQKSIVVPQNEDQLKSINQHGQASSLPDQLLVNPNI